jgi:hypothetical protein
VEKRRKKKTEKRICKETRRRFMKLRKISSDTRGEKKEKEDREENLQRN